MATLGERLKAQQEDRVEQARRKAEQQAQAERAKIIENENRVREFGVRFQQHVTNAIENGQEVKGLKFPTSEPYNTYSWNRENNILTNHPFRYAFQDTINWAAANGLELVLHDEHDGVGLESWWRITVQPL